MSETAGYFQEPSEKRDFLRQIRIFSDVLDLAQLEALAARCGVALFPAGAVLMSQGDFGSSMFAIISGRVTVELADDQNRPTPVATLGEGRIVGEMSLMTGARRTATVSAETDVTALEITKVALEGVLAKSPDLVDSFAVILAKRQADLDRIAADQHRGLTAVTEDLVRQMRRFFAGVLGGKERPDASDAGHNP
jgi:CRP/FNR family cyclic AMP-dependent transcriptional regulator